MGACSNGRLGHLGTCSRGIRSRQAAQPTATHPKRTPTGVDGMVRREKQIELNRSRTGIWGPRCDSNHRASKKFVMLLAGLARVAAAERAGRGSGATIKECEFGYISNQPPGALSTNSPRISVTPRLDPRFSRVEPAKNKPDLRLRGCALAGRAAAH